jgi:hypothetical protein
MKTITTNQKLQLIGLRTLAEQHNKMLQDIEKAATQILGEECEDWVFDYIYESTDLDHLFEYLKIEIKD